METKLIVMKEIEISSFPQHVWNIMIDPIAISKWMLIPGEVADQQPLHLNSKIYWRDDNGDIYLKGDVVVCERSQKLVISLQDSSWKEKVPVGSVTYEMVLSETKNGTLLSFTMGDLSVDPQGQQWFDAYDNGNELENIKQIAETE